MQTQANELNTQTTRRIEYQTGLFIMINSNHKVDHPDASRFANVIRFLANNMHHFIIWAESGSDKKKRVHHRYGPNDGLCRCDFSFEQAPKTGFLHTHMTVTCRLQHDGFVLLDLDLLRDFLRTRLPYVPRVSVKRTRDHNRLERYTQKQMLNIPS